MENFINGINFYELEAQKYWSMPAGWSEERKKDEVHNAIFSGDYIGARKIDGAFYKFLKDEDGNMKLIGRSKGVNGDYLNKLGHVPQLMPFFQSLPNGTCLIGELFFPGNEGSNHVTTIMGCLEEKAIARQIKGQKLNYYVFDVLAFDNVALYKTSIENRVEILKHIQNLYAKEYVQWAEYFEGSELWDTLQNILAEGGEGVVITKKGTCYQAGKRPARQTFKVKKELQETIDVVILGANKPTREYNGMEIKTWKYWENIYTNEKLEGNFYEESLENHYLEPVTKAYFYGWAGSLVIGIRKDDKLVVIGSLSGMTEEVLSHANDYKGKVAEITGMQIMDTENQGIRHPRFVRWRPDLVPSDTDWYRWFK